tara:strand:+ start:308 stop:532 length:225 start_codon:yes stop_codon:yes gene_type:complete
MIRGKAFRIMLDKFFESPITQDARVQIELPNGQMMDISEMSLLENRILGSFESHRLVIKVENPVGAMGKVIRKL